MKCLMSPCKTLHWTFWVGGRTTSSRQRKPVDGMERFSGVGAASYPKTQCSTSLMSSRGFVMSKSNVASHAAHTIHWLELRATVLAVERWNKHWRTQYEALHKQQDCVGLHQQYTQEILHVCHDVYCLRKSTHPEQWRFIRIQHTDQLTMELCQQLY